MGNIERWSEDELKRTLAIADGIDAEGFGATAGTLRDLVFEIRRLRTTNRGAVSLLEDMAACARDAQNAEVGMRADWVEARVRGVLRALVGGQ